MGRNHPGVGWQPMQNAVPVPPSPEHQAEVIEKYGPELLDEMLNAEMWKNNRYTVLVTRRPDGSVMELSIRRNDRRAARDWRDFQRIKTEIAGADVEAFELYPAEDRLMDTANQYFLWCMLPGERIPAGFDDGRNLRDHDEGLAKSKQRPLPDDWKNQENGATT